MPTIKSIVFMDSFEHYLVSQIGQKWNVVGGALSLLRVNGRNGYGLSGTNGTLQKTVGMVRDACVGVAYNTVAFAGSPINIYVDPNLTIASLNHIGDGRFSVSTYGPASSPVFTSYTSPAINQNTWYYLEFKVNVAATNIIFSVYINGQTVLSGSLTYGSSYNLPGTSNISGIGIGFPTGGNRAIIDDLYVDSAGNQLGDTRILRIKPDGDVGGRINWTPSSGTTHYTLVNEDTPETTGLISAGSVGIEDEHTYEDISITGSVWAVQFLSYTKKTDAGVATYKHQYKGAIPARATEFFPSTDYAYFLECYNGLPDSPSTAWTVTTVNQIQMGPNRVT